MYWDGPFHLLPSFGNVKHECTMPKCVIHLTVFADVEWIKAVSSQKVFRGQQFIHCFAIPVFSLIMSEASPHSCIYLTDYCKSPSWRLMQIAVTIFCMTWRTCMFCLREWLSNDSQPHLILMDYTISLVMSFFKSLWHKERDSILKKFLPS